VRRFELGIGPLSARLGYTRPDLSPLQSADDASPIFLLGNYPYAAVSPGSRVVQQSVIITTAEVVAGNFAYARFTPPAGGAWLRRVSVATDAASYAGWVTTNQVVPAGVVVNVGSTARVWRPDDREVFPPISNASVGYYSVNNVFTRDSAISWNPATWWQGTDLFTQCSSVTEGMVATIEYEPPLEGLTRQVK
jgi:hypothetical protein